ncbi:MAG: T9SS type A sorting domain-containing protein [Chitinophagales bacterium]
MNNVSAQNTANIIIQPTAITAAAGSSFNVMVKLDFTSSPATSILDAIEVYLTFDKTKLKVTSITEQPVVAAFSSKPIPVEAAPYTNINANGQISYAAAAASNFPNADFDILAVTFEVIGGANTTTPLTLRRNPPFNNTNARRIGSSILVSPFVANSSVNISSTLPVSLLNLSATSQGKKVTLSWTTSSETNNRGFDVQRSSDGVNWTTIGFVAGAGNSSFVKNYTYADNNLETRRYYYRLKQIDIDDHSKYSVIVSVVINGKGEYALGQNYPNPFRNETTIQYTLPQTGQVKLSLFDISGRAVKVLVSGSKEAGTHAISFNTGSLTRGIYYYRIQVGDFTDVKKLTIQ